MSPLISQIAGLSGKGYGELSYVYKAPGSPGTGGGGGNSGGGGGGGIPNTPGGPNPPTEGTNSYVFPEYTVDLLTGAIAELGTPMSLSCNLGGRPLTPPIIDNGYIRYTVNGMGGGVLGVNPNFNSAAPGIQFDPSGQGNYGAVDYLTPGNPFEFYFFDINSTAGALYELYIAASNLYPDNSYPALPLCATTWEVVPNQHYVVQRGIPEVGFIVLQYMTMPGDAIIGINMRYYNSTALSKYIRISRGLDPDQDKYAPLGEFVTRNYRGLGVISVNNIAYATSVEVSSDVSQKSIALYTAETGYAHGTRVSEDWYEEPDRILNNPGIDFGDGRVSDSYLALAWDIGFVAPGESAGVQCYYIADMRAENTETIALGLS